MKAKLLITFTPLFLLSLSCSFLYGQEEQEEHHHAREFGISLSYVDLIEEDDTAPAIHLHWLKRLEGSESLERWGIGLGFETIFADHTHHTVMATLAFFPIDHLVLSVSPGVVFADEETGWENHYATHIELSYGFEMGEYEIGPVIGYADSDEGSHRMIGLHFGIPF